MIYMNKREDVGWKSDASKYVRLELIVKTEKLEIIEERALVELANLNCS